MNGQEGGTWRNKLFLSKLLFSWDLHTEMNPEMSDWTNNYFSCFVLHLTSWDIGWCHILKAKLHKSSRSTNKFLLICLFILNLRKILIVPNLIIFSHQLVQYFEKFSRGSQKVWYKKSRGLTLLSCWLPFYLSSFNSYVDGFVLKEKSVGLTWVDVVLLFEDPAGREKQNGNKQIYL